MGLHRRPRLRPPLITERNSVNITIDDIVSRYNAEIAKLTQRAILAEAQVESLEGRVAKLEEQSKEDA